MNKKELKAKLDQLGVNQNQYSLHNDLNPDSIVLYQNYQKWEIFYLDERGNRNDYRIFNSENEACIYIYKLFKDAKNIEKEFGINT